MSFTVNGLGDAEFEEVDVFTARSNTQGAPSSVFDYAATRVSLANFQNHITAYLNTQLSETRVSLGNFANQITADNLASQESLNTKLEDTRVSLFNAVPVEVTAQIGNMVTDLTNRMDILEGGGGSAVPNLTSQPVTWTNLSEIRFGTEILKNTSFSDNIPIVVGDIRRVTQSWANGGVTANIGELGTVTNINNSGDVRLELDRGAQYAYIWSSSSQVYNITEREYPYHQITANITGSTFASSDIGKTLLLLPGSGMSNSNWNLTIGKPYTITQVDTGNNRVGFIDNNGAFIYIDDETRAFGRQRGVDWEFSQEVPYGWTIINGEIDTTELALGNVKGVNGAVKIKQVFDTPIVSGTRLAVSVGRPIDQTEGVIDVSADFNNGAETINLDPGDAGEFIIPDDKIMTGINFTTHHGNRIITDVSLFDGVIAGGTAQATTTTLSKISGANGYNAGGSSSQVIPAGQDGYFQFQYGGGGSVNIKVTYLDDDFDNNPIDDAFAINLIENGTIVSADGFNTGANFAPAGTWIRIRHYSANNLIKFQKLQPVYGLNPNYVFPTESNTTGNFDYIFNANERPYIKALSDWNQLEENVIYSVHRVNTTSGYVSVYDFEGNFKGNISQRAIRWEVAELVGEDYVTFCTSEKTTSNTPLYLDASLFHIGSQVNDATIVS